MTIKFLLVNRGGKGVNEYIIPQHGIRLLLSGIKSKMYASDELDEP